MEPGLESLPGMPVQALESVEGAPGPNYSAQSQLARCAAAKAVLARGDVKDPMRWVGAILVEIERIVQREVDRG